MKLPLNLVFWWTACLCLFFMPSMGGADTSLQINIYGPGQSKINTYLAPARLIAQQEGETLVPSRVQDLERVLYEDLGFLPFVHFVPGGELLGGPEVQGMNREDLDFKRFQLSQVDLLVTMGWSAGDQDREQVELRAFDVYTGRMIVGRGYVLRNQGHVEQASRRFSAELMQALTGRSGFFTSELAFVRKSEEDKDIYACTPQGKNLRPLVDLDGYCMSPAWSGNGDKLAMSFVGQDRHELVVWDAQSDSLQRATLPGNTIISPAYWPGRGWVISADPGKSPDIYTLNQDLSLGDPLVEHWAIDISPHFDAQGKAMVFVSSRFGNPHIFLRHMDSGEVERISLQGTYNTNPSISPDGRFVAYSRLIKDQGHRIIVHDRQKKTERQVSFGPGNDEDPAWGPDSYFLAFSSDRSGKYQLYVSTRHADEAKRIPTGGEAATSPAWRPRAE
ncbi:MAG: hypothetical protein U5L00_20620 [Desulfovermiculus sp.]|nr:hypothetical protein [Desulfovermiculus sp.]